MTSQSEHEVEVCQRSESASKLWVNFLRSQLVSDDRRDVEALRLQAEHAMTEAQGRQGQTEMARFSSLSHALERLADGWFSEGGRQPTSHEFEIVRDLSRQQAAQLVSRP